jgi:hypothetical protein
MDKEDQIDREFVINDSVINQDDVFKIIEPLWWSVSIYDGLDTYEKDLSNYSIPQKYVFAIMWYQSEVNNGGHDQFYSNSTGIVWEDAMLGFKEIGLIEGYEIIKESINRLGGKPEKDRAKRNKQLEKYDKSLSDLDDSFYELGGEIETALLKYIRSNKAEFYFKGVIKTPKEF